jgi:hypothetical protein
MRSAPRYECAYSLPNSQLSPSLSEHLFRRDVTRCKLAGIIDDEAGVRWLGSDWQKDSC